MDQITPAIIGALIAGVKKVGESTIPDLYKALKTLLIKKFGKKSEVAEATDKLEARPESEARQKLLAEEVAQVKADQDPEILEAAKKLTQALQAQPGGSEIIQNIIMGNGAVFSKGNVQGSIVTGSNNKIGSE